MILSLNFKFAIDLANKVFTILSDTNFPFDINSSIYLPNDDLSLISFLNKSPVDN